VGFGNALDGTKHKANKKVVNLAWVGKKAAR